MTHMFKKHESQTSFTSKLYGSESKVLSHIFVTFVCQCCILIICKFALKIFRFRMRQRWFFLAKRIQQKIVSSGS